VDVSESDDRDRLRELRAAESALDDRPSPRVRRTVLQAAAQAVTPAANDDRAARLPMARAAVAQGPINTSAPAREATAVATPKPRRHWPLPLAASVLVGTIGLAVFYRMPREQPVTQIASAAPERSVPTDKAALAEPAAPAGAAAPSVGAASKADLAPAAPPPPAVAAQTQARVAAARPEITAPAAADRVRPLAFPAAETAKRAVPMAPEPASATAQLAPAPAPAAPAEALAGKDKAVDDQRQKTAAPARLARQAPAFASPIASAASGAARAGADASQASDAPAAATAAAGSVARPSTPQQWIERIIELRHAGRQDDADRELAQFRKRNPGFAVPAAALPPP
jgi:hypothetical protein